MALWRTHDAVSQFTAENQAAKAPGLGRTLRSTEGEGSMRTVAQRHSNLPLALCTKRGCRVSSRKRGGCCCAWLLPPLAAAADGTGATGAAATAPPGTQPRSAMSWHPLHTPRLKVSGLIRQ